MSGDGERVGKHDRDTDSDEHGEAERTDGQRVELAKRMARGIGHGERVDSRRHRATKSRDPRQNHEARECRERDDGHTANERCEPRQSVWGTQRGGDEARAHKHAGVEKHRKNLSNQRPGERARWKYGERGPRYDNCEVQRGAEPRGEQ